jgi:COP9 signalosome complex subunit 8
MQGRIAVETHIQTYIAKQDWDRLAQQLEDYELEVSLDPGHKDQPFYAVQLFVHLIKNEMDSARFLWKRIPHDIKKTNAELQAVWKIGKCMWQREYAELYKAFTNTWEPLNKTLAELLLGRVRQQTFELLSKNYTTISAESAATFLGMAPQDATKFCLQNGWTQDGAFLVPHWIEKSAAKTAGIDQLQSLTEFVVYLEKKR